MNYAMKTSIVIAGLIMGGALAACAQTQTSESTGSYVDDSSITTKVKTALLGDVGLKVFDIHVDTHHNVVLLTGVVNSQRTVNHAGDVASQVAGVSSVQNDLVVR
jgi:osmotically-inducible protein OsmY